MKIHSALLLTLLAAFPMTSLAEVPATTGAVVEYKAPGKAEEAAIVNVTARVKAINKATREVTLKGPQGNLITIVAGDEVKRFDQIKVGDSLDISYTTSLALELKKGGGKAVSRVDRETSTAKPGVKPSGILTRETTIMADVMKVDAATQVVTLRGPNRTVEVRVQDPEVFKTIAKGDQVEAKFTEAMAISMEAAKPKKK